MIKVGKNAEDTIYNNRWKILVCIVTVTFMNCLDASIVNVALPMISEDLGVTMAQVQWIVTSYLIAISCLILLGGRFGDVKGKCNTFKIGIFLFTLGSLFCGLSHTLPLLVISRVFQGIGASLTMANSLGIITDTFSKGGRGKAVGISGASVALGTMVGPALGGIIVSLRWEYIFLINVPIGIVAFIAAMKILPKEEGHKDKKIDIIGTILFAIFIISIVLVTTEGQFVGYTSFPIIIGFIISIFSFILFIIIEMKIESPVLDLSIFKNNLFSISVFCGFISFIAISCFTILLPFYLQDVLKLTPFYAGLFMIIYPITLSIVSPLSGTLADKIGSEIIALIGLSMLSLSFVLMSTIHEATPIWLVGIYSIVMGLGNGMFQSPNNTLVMSTVNKNKLGIAGSVNALVRNLGMIFGVTLGTTLLYSKMSNMLGYTVTNYINGKDHVFIMSMDFVYIVAAIICFVGVIISATRFKKKLSR
ncbi:MFS transporter [Clostridium moniliforme]|uniref:MFS transporter n=1 Tax=Clostridium moniliforme TaxID=39489 RepID=UPI001AE4C685|nr:MFS transporter [Clostridium moniliforme]